jgi:hypothetical protein
LGIVQVIKSRRMRLGRACGMYRVEERCIWSFGGGTEGKTPLGRCRHRWEDNVKTCLKEVAWELMDWLNLAQDRDKWWALVIAVMNFQVPSYVRNFLTS